MPLFRAKPDAAKSVELVEAVAPGPPAPPPIPEWTPPVVPADLPDLAVADIVTNLWRAGNKLAADGIAPSADGDADRALRAAARHVRAAVETFAGAGIEVQDHDGTAFDPGLALEVVAYEPRPGTERETVLETVRPCVYRGGRRIQIGQVVVAQPPSKSKKGKS